MLITEYISTCLIEKLDYNELDQITKEDILPIVNNSDLYHVDTKNIRWYKSAFMFYLDDQKKFYKETDFHKDNKEIHKKWANEPKDIKLKYKQYEEDDKKLVDKESNEFIQEFYDNLCILPITTYKIKFCEAYFGKLENYPIFFSYNNLSNTLCIFKEDCIDRIMKNAFSNIVIKYPCAAESSEFESYGPGGCGCPICIDEALQTYIVKEFNHIKNNIIPKYNERYNLSRVIEVIKKDYLC
jgi:hypothetical protein